MTNSSFVAPCTSYVDLFASTARSMCVQICFTSSRSFNLGDFLIGRLHELVMYTVTFTTIPQLQL